MSDAGALAGTSATLRRLLSHQMRDPVPITISAPVRSHGDVPGRRVNLFLYQVLENGFLRNQPGFGSTPTGAYGKPPLSLDLRFLITAHGDADDDLVSAQALLGDVMQVMHEHPILGPSLNLDGDEILDPSLSGQVEQIKIYMEAIELRDLAHIWNSFSTPFRLAIPYRVTVIRIDPRGVTTFPPLVGEPPSAGPRVSVGSVAAPRLTALRVIRGDGVPSTAPYAAIGDRLRVAWAGSALDDVTFKIAGIPVTPLPTKEDGGLEFVIPDEPQLRPGPVALTGVKTDGQGRPVSPTSECPFTLVPQVQQAKIHERSGMTSLVVTGSRLWAPGTTGQVSFGRCVIPSSEYIEATDRMITVRVPPTVPRDPMNVRIIVDGVSSIDDVGVRFL